MMAMIALPGAAAAQPTPVDSAAQAASVASEIAAASSTQIPEPGDLALFLIGVAGLIVGRWTARSRKGRRE